MADSVYHIDHTEDGTYKVTKDGGKDVAENLKSDDEAAEAVGADIKANKKGK